MRKCEFSYNDSIVAQECNTGLSSIIYRNWKAEDESGNVSYCTQVINVINTGMAFLTFPPDYNDFDKPALSCNPLDPHFYPAPELTGYPGTELCSMVNYSYTDMVIHMLRIIQGIKTSGQLLICAVVR